MRQNFHFIFWDWEKGINYIVEVERLTKEVVVKNDFRGVKELEGKNRVLQGSTMRGLGVQTLESDCLAPPPPAM